MQFRIEGVSAFLTLCRALLWRLGLLVFFALRVLGQTSQAEAGRLAATPSPGRVPNTAEKVQTPSAAVVMQESILRQKQALLASQLNAQQGSLAQQRAWLRLQRQDALAGCPRTPLSASANTLGSCSDDFFSTGWEPAPPAA